MTKNKIAILIIALTAIVVSLIGQYFLDHSSQSAIQSVTSGQFFVDSNLEGELLIYRDLEYAKADSTSLKLDLYYPSENNASPPLIIWIHGGAWTSGDKNDVAEMCRQLASAGYAVASLNFRSSAEEIFPAAIYDLKAGVRWLRARADEYGFDASRIGVIGSSSGGHLAALLGTSGAVVDLEGQIGDHLDQSSVVQAVVDLFGPVDVINLTKDCAGECTLDHDDPDSPESRFLGCPLPSCLDLAAVASPITYLDVNDPPFLILHGDQDTTIPLAQSVHFAANLDRVGVDNKLIVAKGYAHSRAMFWKYTDQIVDFFDTYLK